MNGEMWGVHCTAELRAVICTSAYSFGDVALLYRYEFIVLPIFTTIYFKEMNIKLRGKMNIKKKQK